MKPLSTILIGIAIVLAAILGLLLTAICFALAGGKWTLLWAKFPNDTFFQAKWRSRPPVIRVIGMNSSGTQRESLKVADGKSACNRGNLNTKTDSVVTAGETANFHQNETWWPQVHPRLLAKGSTRRYILALGFTSNLHRFPKTERLHHCQLPAVDAGGVAPKGLGTGGHEPLMRNRRAPDLSATAIGILPATLLSAWFRNQPKIRLQAWVNSKRIMEFQFAHCSTEDAGRARYAMTRKASGVCAELAALTFCLNGTGVENGKPAQGQRNLLSSISASMRLETTPISFASELLHAVEASFTGQAARRSKQVCNAVGTGKPIRKEPVLCSYFVPCLCWPNGVKLGSQARESTLLRSGKGRKGASLKGEPDSRGGTKLCAHRLECNHLKELPACRLAVRPRMDWARN